MAASVMACSGKIEPHSPNGWLAVTEQGAVLVAGADQLEQHAGFGYVPFDKAGADLLFGFISQRYGRCSFVVTTNLPFARWSEVFLDATAAAAVIDRIVHHATVLTTAGDSYRLKVATRNQASRATQEVPRQ